VSDRTGRPVTTSVAEYVIPANADLRELDVLFAGEPDSSSSFGRLCTKTHAIALLCATSVFSVSLWLNNSQQTLTTETQRTRRLHREIS